MALDEAATIIYDTIGRKVLDGSSIDVIGDGEDARTYYNPRFSEI